MVTRSARRRARIALAIGLCLGALGAGTGEAAPDEETSCTTTVCAVAGVTATIRCDHPDTRTVSCQGVLNVWGAGRSNTASLPGALDWRGEGRCGGACSANELAQGAAAWNGVTSSSGSVAKTIYFPTVRRSLPTRTCILYTITGTSVTTARALAPLRLDMDSVESTKGVSAEAFACNLV